MKFNDRLKELRKQSPIMQKDIAAIINVSTRTFQDYESGKTEPNIERLIMLADIFQVSVDYLIGHDTAKKYF